MDSGAEWLLATLVGVALLFGSQWIRIFLFLRGTRLSPADAPDDETLAAIPLRAFEQAAIEELESLGFVRLRDTFDRLSWEPVRSVFLAHRDLRHFARLQLQGTPPIGLPVTFLSFAADGSPIATINRIGWMAALECDALDLVDARVDSVEAQWAAHCERATHAEPLLAAVAMDRMDAGVAAGRAQSLATGLWIRGSRFVQPSFRSAWRATMALMAERRLLVRPLQSAATGADHGATFLVAMLEQQQRLKPLQHTERGIKFALFAATLGVAWVLWGMLFDWRTAAELIGVVLVHELGHAVAMLAFGWTNLHVFFIPLMGAVATGGRPGRPSAWKDVVVLLAGPVPGLAAGLALLASPLAADPRWHSAALLAVSVNALNLLPLAPLDGGQLMAIALFNRWPYARLAFTTISAAGILAVGWLLHAPAAFFIALVLVLGWRRELRVVAIEQTVSRSGGAGSDIARVVEAVSAHQALGLLQRSTLAQLVLRRRQVPRAGVALGLAIVAVLGVLLGAAAPPLAAAFAQAPRANQTAQRSPAQRAFDRHWIDAHRDGPASLPGLLADTALLSPQDGRRRDVEWLQTRALPPAQRASAVADWLRSGNGHFVSRTEAALDFVDSRVLEAANQSPSDRVAIMRSLTNWTHGLPAGLTAVDVTARLRLAEAIDLSGDQAGAARMLDEIAGEATSRPDCDCGLREAIEARAWFESTHDRPFEAIRVLSGPIARTLGTPGPESLAVAQAWAFLQAGDRSGGLKQMRAALHADRLDADFQPRSGADGHARSDDDEDDQFEPWQGPELALALHAAGRPDDARRLCQAVALEACASEAGRRIGDIVPDGPWQARHARERALLMQELAKPAERGQPS